jgi:hypothetical protein
VGFVKKNTIVRDLIKILEFKPLSYTEIQDFVFYHQSRPVNLKNFKGRGFWCTNINNLIRTKTIYKNEDEKYVTNKGQSDSDSFFSSQRWYH